MGWEDDEEDGWRPPLPPEDRLWRHPSEVAALRGVAHTAQRTSPSRRLWGIAATSAVGGALAVGTLWLALGSPTRTTITNTAVAVREITATPRLVSAPDWAAAVTDTIGPAVAAVETAAGTGSAVLVRDDGTLLTAAAVVGDVRTVVVHLPEVGAVRAAVLGTDPTTGVAVLRVEADPDRRTALPVAPVAVGPGVRRGEWTAVAGTGAMPLAATVEDLAATAEVDRTSVHGLVRLDLPVPTPALGGALVDDAGALTGVLVATDDAHGYALPVAEALAVVDDLDRYGEVRRPWIGVEGTDLPAGGVRLDSVAPGGPGAVAGLAPGDVLVRLDGQAVDAVASLVTGLRSLQPGDAVPVEVRRGGVAWTAEVILGHRPT